MIGADPYSPLTRRLFREPRHQAATGGKPERGESVYLAAQGVRVRLNALVSDGVLSSLSFRAYGCPHFLAACEWLCESLEGKPAATLSDVKPAEIMQTLGLPVAKTGRILVLEDAANALGACFARSPTP